MEISVALLDYFPSLVVGVAVSFLAFALISTFGTVTNELKEQQVSSGDSALADLYINISPETFFLLRIAAALLSFGIFYLLLGSVLFCSIVAVIAFFVPNILLVILRRKRIKKVELQLIEGLELLGSSLKSGLTLPQATELLVREFPAPISQEFSLVLAETRLGVDFIDALHNMANRMDSTIVQILASGVAITKRCGGDLTVIFTNIAQTIRDRATIEGKLEAVTAQGRFQGLILGLMPFALIVVLYFIDRPHVETLFGYQIGIWAFTAVVIMVILAQLWIRKLLDIDV